MTSQRKSNVSGDSSRAARTGDRPEVRPGVQSSDQSVEPLWDVAAVGAYLGVSTHAIYKMTARAAPVPIPHIRIGSKLRFRRADVDRWLTLLTVSNLAALTKMREKVSKVIHGNDSQTQTG